MIIIDDPIAAEAFPSTAGKDALDAMMALVSDEFSYGGSAKKL